MNWIAPLLTAEILLFVCAGFFWLRSRAFTVAEAGAGAIVLVFVSLSIVHQLSFCIGSHWPARILETGAIITVLSLGLRRIGGRHRIWGPVRGLFRQAPFPSAVLVMAWIAMAGMVGAGWLSTDPATIITPWNPAAVPWSGNGLSSLSTGQALTPLNATGLFYHGARFGLSPHAIGLGLMAHISMGLSTYALARRYAWPPMALTVTLLVLSMPRLVVLARWPSAEMIAAASVTYAMVLIYRLVEQHRPGDFYFFLVCIAFSISSHPASLPLALVMSILTLLMIVRRHGWLQWRELIMGNPPLTVLFGVVSLVLAQVPVFLWNLAHDHPLFGRATVLVEGGIIAAAANSLRYLLALFDPTAPAQELLHWMVGVDLRALVMGIYRHLVVPLFGRAGGMDPFVPIFSGNGGCGFGPFAMLLILPAMIHVLLRGPRRLKGLGIAWGGYVYICALVLAWSPPNLAVLTPLFAANGFVVAFFLPPWRIRRRGARILQTAFAVLLATFLILSQVQPHTVLSLSVLQVGGN